MGIDTARATNNREAFSSEKSVLIFQQLLNSSLSKWNINLEFEVFTEELSTSYLIIYIWKEILV